MFFPRPVVAQVPGWVHATNAVEFFTNLSSRLLSAGGYAFDAGSIPVYTNGTFTFSPEVHRLLQVSANIYDASTNRADRGGPDFPFLPSVFRPVFKVVGSNVFIGDWVEETGGTNWQRVPRELSDPAAAAEVQPNDNIYDVPWVIGVKQGFPNFNEFAMQSVAQVTRRLQMRKLSLTSAPTQTNQMFLLGISNVFAVEAWNPYPSNYSCAVDLRVVNDMTIGLSATNDPVLDPRGVGVSYQFNFTAATNLPANAWSGYGQTLATPNAGSFVVPLITNLNFLPNAIYRTDSGATPFFTANTNLGSNLFLGFEQTGKFPLPEFRFEVTNRIRFIMLDHDTQRVVDYVQLGGLVGARNLSDELAYGTGTLESSLWSPTRQTASSIHSPPLGVISQIQVALGILNVFNWNDYGIGNPSGLTKDKEIDSFRVFCGLSPLNPGTTNTNLVQNVPFTPTRRTSQILTWQANDPLVHRLLDDLQSVKTLPELRRELPNGPLQTLPNIGRLNNRFEPWGGNPATAAVNDSVPPYGTGYKDPLVRSANDWSISAFGPLSAGWLGQVHRGTPWQTLYLKSTDVSLSLWSNWLGGWTTDAAMRARPVNDRPLINSLVMLLNTNHPANLLSVNETNVAGWHQALDGLCTLTNTATDQELSFVPPQLSFETNLMSGLGPQAAAMAGDILQTRGNRIWQTVGDVLATPSLSDASPWLNLSSATQLQRGITDEAYETVASQLQPRLRTESVGVARVSGGQCELEFSGYDGFQYVIEAGDRLTDWTVISTNVPVNGVFGTTDPSLAFTNRFYRARLLP